MYQQLNDGAIILGSDLHLAEDGSIVELNLDPEQTRTLYEALARAYRDRE